MVSKALLVSEAAIAEKIASVRQNIHRLPGIISVSDRKRMASLIASTAQEIFSQSRISLSRGRLDILDPSGVCF